jgi:ribonuclease HII
MPRPHADRAIENSLRRLGFARIAGTDEVGRGCLAGPVMAGVVVLDPDRDIAGLRDSKLLSPASRERLYDEITCHALCWAVAAVEPAEIDRINIRQASLLAMRNAVFALAPLPDFVLVDAFRIPDLPMAQRGIAHGDARCSAIAAASIVAKVTRDRLMGRLHELDPRYGFDRHKGYPTPEHALALARFGHSPVHRLSFRVPSLFDAMDEVAGTGEDPGSDR